MEQDSGQAAGRGPSERYVVNKVAYVNEAQVLVARVHTGTISKGHRKERVENAIRGDHDQCRRGFRNERSEVATRRDRDRDQKDVRN